jgi:hypothetical protein
MDLTVLVYWTDTLQDSFYFSFYSNLQNQYVTTIAFRRDVHGCAY